jgi:PTH1 family peptidyl-tRNA hydrolase
MYLIVGLGNPGPLYRKSRHNVGFKVINIISRLTKIKLTKRKFRARIGIGTYNQKKVILAKPQTYMNRSGEAISKIVNFYHIENSNIIIIYDDLDLNLGRIRIRRRGSAGGHKGLLSILENLKTLEIPRIRLGINPGHKIETPAQFVLEEFTPEEEIIIKMTLNRASKAALYILDYGIDKCMSKFNQKSL